MIQVNHLYFGYGKKDLIKDVNFSVGKGEIFGILGPSGAGKSTIQKIILGVLNKYQGEVRILGEEAKHHNSDFYEKIGVDFEYSTLYNHLTAFQNLAFFSSLYQGDKLDAKELLKKVGLDEQDIPVGKFSKGMKSRLNFIRAIIHKPDILLLDEPNSGLDPNNRRLMNELILEEKEKGTAVILTTHNMEDATQLCDRVAFIVDGEIKKTDSPHNLMLGSEDTKIVYKYLENGIEKEGTCLTKEMSKDYLLKKIIEENRVLTIHSKEPNLEDVFAEVTGRRLV